MVSFDVTANSKAGRVCLQQGEEGGDGTTVTVICTKPDRAPKANQARVGKTVWADEHTPLTVCLHLRRRWWRQVVHREQRVEWKRKRRKGKAIAYYYK